MQVSAGGRFVGTQQEAGGSVHCRFDSTPRQEDGTRWCHHCWWQGRCGGEDQGAERRWR